MGQIRLVGGFQDDDAARMSDRNRGCLGDFERAAQRHGFRFRRMNGPRQSAHLDSRLPSAMELVDLAVDKNVPGVGVAYQRHLSSEAHAKLHGLTRVLTPLAGTPPKPARTSINASAAKIALELLAGPVCASNLADRLSWFTRWTMDSVTSPRTIMLETWGRIGRVPYPAVSKPA